MNRATHKEKAGTAVCDLRHFARRTISPLSDSIEAMYLFYKSIFHSKTGFAWNTMAKHIQFSIPRQRGF